MDYKMPNGRVVFDVHSSYTIFCSNFARHAKEKELVKKLFDNINGYR